MSLKILPLRRLKFLLQVKRSYVKFNLYFAITGHYTWEFFFIPFYVSLAFSYNCICFEFPTNSLWFLCFFFGYCDSLMKFTLILFCGIQERINEFYSYSHHVLSKLQRKLFSLYSLICHADIKVIQNFCYYRIW